MTVTTETLTPQNLKTSTVELVRVDNSFHFEGTGTSNVPIHIDAGTDIGGHNEGARPMELLLMGLAGCSAIDIIVILQKQKQEIRNFSIQVDGQREVEAHPAPFKNIHLTYRLTGKIDAEKLKRAIELSMDKYCSAVAQIRPTATITHSFEVQEE